MPIIRTFARQGHAVPDGYRAARGPFPPEILAQTRVVYNTDHGDSLHETLDNIRMFRCKECREILYKEELDTHECEE
jgi:hypothetical protein